MQGTKLEGLWEKSALVIMCGVFGSIALMSARTAHEREPNGLRPHQLVRAINAASVAKGGNIGDVAVKRGAQHTFVDVSIFSEDGHKYAVRVEGDTGKVVSIESHRNRKSAETTRRSRSEDKTEEPV